MDRESTTDSESHVSDTFSSEPETDLSDDEYAKEDSLLYDGAELTTKSFCYLLKEFNSKHTISKKANLDLLQLICTILPKENNCPKTLYKFDKATAGFEHKKSHFKLCSECQSSLSNGNCTNTECSVEGKVKKPVTFYSHDLEEPIENIIKGNSF